MNQENGPGKTIFGRNSRERAEPLNNGIHTISTLSLAVKMAQMVHPKVPSCELPWFAASVEARPAQEENDARGLQNTNAVLRWRLDKTQASLSRARRRVYALEEALKEAESRDRKSKAKKAVDHLGYFRLLGLDWKAFDGLSEEEIYAKIIANYRLALKIYHPDVDDRRASGETTDLLVKAKDVLSNPETRSEYMTRTGRFRIGGHVTR